MHKIWGKDGKKAEHRTTSDTLYPQQGVAYFF